MAPRVTTNISIAGTGRIHCAPDVQEVAFFDKDEHSSGALSAELAVDTAHIRGAVGDQVGLVTQNVVTFIAAYVIALVSGWKLTLVSTTVVYLQIWPGSVF